MSLGRLVDVLTSAEKKQAVVRDGVKLVEEEVARKGGVSGLAIKGAFGLVKKVKADFVPGVLDRLLPDFAAHLERFWEEREQSAPGVPMETFLGKRSGEVADALLAITDEKVRQVEHGPMRATYEKLRPAARRNVEEAVPGIGRLIDAHA